MMKKVLYYFSPCVLAAIFLLIVIINALMNRGSGEDWGMLIVFVTVPFLIGVVVADLIVRFLFKDNIKKVWLIEIGILLLAILIIKLKSR